LIKHFAPRHEVLGLCHHQPGPGLVALDLRERRPIAELVQDYRPNLILHTVGLTDVDRCDQDLEAALDVNTRTTLHVRLAAESIGCKLIHISTNDVFDGAEGLYREQDLPRPVNMYAYTKLMAEQMLYHYHQALILRFTILSWYASGKTTFAAWLIKSLRQGQRVGLYTDQFNSPLYVSTLAEWIEALFDARGTYHLGSERKSRWATGVAIAEACGLDTDLIDSCLAADAKVMAPRPLDVSLDCSQVAADYGLRTTFAAEVAKLLADQPASSR
jgi:dTDP-4-dehydrorhamnose reductase